MSALVDDGQIAALLNERKPAATVESLTPSAADGAHLRLGRLYIGDRGTRFQVKVRRSRLDAKDFSVILAWDRPDETGLFLLTRCNGLSHQHRNKLEGDRFFDFHVHRATQRYQLGGFKEDAYAKVTTSYDGFGGAVEHFLAICAFRRPTHEQMRLDG